jgi:hypothetical protein
MIMSTEQRVVDDRVFVLGLDELYRAAIKKHERGELLACARRVAGVLGATPANVPIEGYYAEDDQLSEYFRLMRALQAVSRDVESKVDTLPEFHRLREIASARLYGVPLGSTKLLPVGRDALAFALRDTYPEWTVEGLTRAAYVRARDSDEISLVALAALTQDSVVLAAVRESVVLYAEQFLGSGGPPPRPQYVWKVNEELASRAERFVSTFNELFDGELPHPGPSQAEHFWLAYQDNEITGRCVCIGSDDTTAPVRYYHWVIECSREGEWTVRAFWDTQIRSSSQQRAGGRGRGRKRRQ